MDYVCDIFGIKVGVFVICVMKYWGEYMEEDVMNLFIKKLKGIYILYKQIQVYFMKCRIIMIFVIGIGFILEKGWGCKGRVGFRFFFIVMINKLYIIFDYCEYDMYLIYIK